MEGRTIVRPDLQRVVAGGAKVGPSMEGRTIVRPDVSPCITGGCARIAFNGGPDNRPARLASQ